MFFDFMKKKYESVSVGEIDNLSGKIELIDIREPYEYAGGHLAKAKNIPMGNLLNNTEKYLDKSKEYYIICQSGARSSRVSNALASKGYKVINVAGGTGSYRGNLKR
jgi:rhodanese-related sulfurtransferase